jgi:hypothetical protein
MSAQEQHHELLQAIRKHSSGAESDIQLVVIPLGVAGALHTSAKKHITEELGVTGPSLDTLLCNLHMHAVRSLTRVIRYRRIKMGTRLGKQWSHRGAAQQAACTAGANSSKKISTAAKSNNITQRTAASATATSCHSSRLGRADARERRGNSPLTAYCWGWGWGWDLGYGGLFGVGSSSSSSGGVLLPPGLAF